MRGDTARLAGDIVPVHPDPASPEGLRGTGQESEALRGPPLSRRSGSEKRLRSISLNIRLTPAERAKIEAAAERAGLSSGSYARNTLLGSPSPRQVRRPPVEKRLLVRLLGEVGSVRGLLNQLAHRFNSGLPTDRQEVLDAIASLSPVRNAILKALGRIE